jgi:colanic acid biosynthesis glycosyl transferase WcaI
MKIVLLTSIFKPEPVVGAQTANTMAVKLASDGHQITVVTSFPSRPAGKLYPGYKIGLYHKENDPCGFEIMRCFSLPSPKSTLLSRFAENITFGLSAALYILFLPKVDCLYSNTWFIFASSLMSLVARIKKIPYIIRVTDLYPESMVSQKRLKTDSLLFRLMRRVDKWIADGAAHVSVLTPQFLKIYVEDRGIPVHKVSVIPDWVENVIDCGEFEKENLVRQQFSIPEKSFLAAYGGNIGVAAGVDTLIRAGAMLPDTRMLIAGSGSELLACQMLAKEIAKESVSFFSPWPKEQTMAVYQAADVLILPTKGEQSKASIPSKLIGYMLSGRPIVAAALPGTELQQIVDESQCGWVIPPDDPLALAQMISQVNKTSKDERLKRGRSGREYAIRNLTMAANLPKMVTLIENIALHARKGGENEYI